MSEEKPPWEGDAESKPAESSGETPSWMLGTGVDTDMTGDARPGGGSNIRYWMKAGTERKIIFLTDGDGCPVLYEHQVQLGGSWRNWITCLEPLGQPCPICHWANTHDNQFARYKGQYYTIIDTTEFTDRAGKVRSNEKRLLVAKKDTGEILKRKYLGRLEAKQSLRGAKFKVYRTEKEKSPNVGEDFEFLEMVDLSTIEDSSDFDYAEILKPDAETARSAYARIKSEREPGKDTFEGTPEGTGAKVEY
jgi:hypothetical protein